MPPETLIHEADAAMYRAKQGGRARYELFNERSRHRASSASSSKGALRQAVERSELRVHFQPQAVVVKAGALRRDGPGGAAALAASLGAGVARAERVPSSSRRTAV